MVVLAGWTGEEGLGLPDEALPVTGGGGGTARG